MDKTTLVIGGSIKPYRYSNKAIRSLVRHGLKVYSIGLREGEVDGVRIEKPFPELPPIDTVTMYVGSKNQPFYYDFILSIGPRRVIFNPGTENEELEAELEKKGIQIVHDCTLVMLSHGEY
jgi:uncharacterized protein